MDVFDTVIATILTAIIIMYFCELHPIIFGISSMIIQILLYVILICLVKYKLDCDMNDSRKDSDDQN